MLQLFTRYLQVVSDHQEAANATQQISGEAIECEADEVCFRCRPAKTVTGEDALEWSGGWALQSEALRK